MVNSPWHLIHSNWWMLQWQLAGWFSLGIHVDLRKRITHNGKIYGPYLDIHVGPCIISIGRNPVYSGEIDCISSASRGGLSANNN